MNLDIQLLALSVIPAIVLLVYIFKKDKLEKEPKGLLLKCFICGVISIIPAIICEYLGEYLFEDSLVVGSVSYAAVDCFLVVALSEEGFKYFMLKRKTWKSPEFNCMFDGIVYSVFVSLGFAAFENITYVFENGVGTAILRMFTAVPGHACDAVFMGYFYSLAKQAEVNGDKRRMRKNKRRALWIPVLLHGIYDGLISLDPEVVGDDTFFMAAFIWIVFTIGLFVASFIRINKVSKNDRFFVEQRAEYGPTELNA